METARFIPQGTAEIPLPLGERVPPGSSGGETPLPRCLRLLAGRTRAIGNIRALLVLFALLVALQIVLHVRLSRTRALAVYDDRPAWTQEKP